MKLSKMGKLILLLQLSYLFFSCSEEVGSVRLIPEGYKGPVVILFNQSNGEPEEYENGKRVYRIPEDGVLITQFKPNYGLEKNSFYYIDSIGNKTEIPFIITQVKDSLLNINDRTKTYAFAEQALGEGKGYDPGFGKYITEPARKFYIGNLLDIEKSYRDLSRFSTEKRQLFKKYVK